MNMPMNMPKDMLGRGRVIPLAEARKLLAMHLPQSLVGGGYVSLHEALGRVTMGAVLSPEDLPPYPRSTMDGYAVLARDTFGATESLPSYLEVSGEVLMGEKPKKSPAKGECFRISTGGLLPESTNAVVMLEHTVKVDDSMIEVVHAVADGNNIIGVGEDVKKGEVILSAGHTLRPQDLGMLAGLGIDTVLVRQKVRVGIISTGDEIVPFTETPPPGKIRDMNAIHLAGLVEEAGAVVHHYGIVKDEEDQFRRTAATALEESDLVLFSGSSSVGTRDMGERVLDSLGDPGIIVHGVAIKPGKPVIIALSGNKPMFGLPGHPVSAAVAFEQFVRPTIQHLAGKTESNFPQTKQVKARLMRNLNSASGRRDFVRVQLTELVDEEGFAAVPVLGKSGALSTMVRAHGYIVLPESLQGLEHGDMVEVNLFTE